MTIGINKIKNIFIKVLKCFCIKYQNENLSWINLNTYLSYINELNWVEKQNHHKK